MTPGDISVARARFTLGLLALHNFQYELAQELFQMAEVTERRERGRAYPMALWGAALATFQILWQGSDCEKGKAFLKRIPRDATDWITEREKAYIDTGFALYPKELSCEKDDQFSREERFMKAMKKVTRLYPEDTEAALFRVVSSAAVSAQSPCSGPCPETASSRRRVLRELSSLEEKNPSHSGVIHYIIHVCDTPELYTEGNRRFVEEMLHPQKYHSEASSEASFGLKAAHRYPRIANSSCHALHMPSHIFMRLGQWRMSLKSNLISIKVLNKKQLSFI